MAKIEVSTTQNVIIQYDTANFMWRMIAWLIDTTIVFSFIFLIIYFFSSLLISNDAKSINIYIWILILFVFRLTYSLLIEIFTNGQSIGKRIVGIQVIKLNGNALEMNDYLIRWAYRAIDFGFSAYSIGTISIFMSEKNQRLGDMIANTTVIKLKSEKVVTLEDLQNLPDKDDYIPKYPLVIRYTDEDMLVLKSLLLRYYQYKNQTYANLLKETVGTLKSQMDLTDIRVNDSDFLRDIISEYVILTR